MTPTLNPAQILLVEDSAGDVRLTQEVLAESEFPNDLHVASDGDEALAFLRREAGHEGAPRPDLVLLDMNLPRRNGREVLAEMRADAELCGIPVIMLTTSSDDADVQAAYDLGANSFITKPIDFGAFTQVVRSIERFWLSVVSLPQEH